MNGLRALLSRRFFARVSPGAVLVLALWWGLGATAALAAALGYAVTLVNALLTYWHLERAVRSAGADPQRNLRIMLRCALERFAVTVMLFALGIGVWHLPPLPLIGGFVVGLIAQHTTEILKKA